MAIWHRLAQFAIGAVALGLGIDPARAACVAQPSAIVWSYPGDGAVNVPVDATVWLYLRDHSESLLPPELDGAPMAPGPHPFSYDPGPLAENAGHVIRIPSEEGDASAAELRIEFQTGDRSVSATLPGVAVGPVTLAGFIDNMSAWGFPDGGPDRCQDLFFVKDCFDTGQVPVYAIEAEQRPLAWLVTWINGDEGGPRIHPGDCGPPLLVDNQGPSCSALRAIFDGGVASETTEACPIARDAGSDGSAVIDASIPLEGGSARGSGGSPGEGGASPSSGAGSGGVSHDDSGARAADAALHTDAASESGPGDGASHGSDGSNPGCGCSLASERQARSIWLTLGLVLFGLSRRKSTGIGHPVRQAKPGWGGSNVDDGGDLTRDPSGRPSPLTGTSCRGRTDRPR